MKLEIISEMEQDFLTVNGQFQPVARIKLGVWYRLRLIYAGSSITAYLDIRNAEGEETDKCQMLLLAKDGIYVNDLPRKLNNGGVVLPPGGRADVALMCTELPATLVSQPLPTSMWAGLAIHAGEVVLSFADNGDDTDPAGEPSPPQGVDGAFTWFPSYLADLRNVYPDITYTINYEHSGWSGGEKQLCNDFGMVL